MLNQSLGLQFQNVGAQSRRVVRPSRRGFFPGDLRRRLTNSISQSTPRPLPLKQGRMPFEIEGDLGTAHPGAERSSAARLALGFACNDPALFVYGPRHGVPDAQAMWRGPRSGAAAQARATSRHRARIVRCCVRWLN